MPISPPPAMCDRPRSLLMQSPLKRAIVLNSLAFGLVGWQLSINSLIIYCATFFLLLILWLTLRTQPWIYGLLGFFPQTLSLIFCICLLITLTLIYPALIIVTWLPLLTFGLLYQELRFRRYLPLQAIAIAASVAVLGLAVGQLIDVYHIPSPRL